MAVCSQSYLKEKMKMESGARLPGARQGCTCTRHLLPDAPHSAVRILRTDGHQAETGRQQRTAAGLPAHRSRNVPGKLSSSLKVPGGCHLNGDLDSVLPKGQE